MFNQFNMDPADWINAIVNAPYSQDVKDALLVRLADDSVDMYGKTKLDTITPAALNGHSRLSLQVHPYPWRPSGASSVVVYIDPFGKRRVVLVYNKRRDKRSDKDALKIAGVPHDWRLPEGYMHPKPCKGGEAGIALVNADDMDEAEELIVKKVPHAQAYTQIAAKSEHGVTGRMTPAFDKTMQDCARREVIEEVGFNPSDDNMHFVTLYDDNAAVGLYLINANTKQPGPPTLKADGVEIAHAEWGRLEAFEIKNVDGAVKVYHPYYDDNGNEFSIEVPMKYALIIGKGIQHSRKMQIETISKDADGLSLFADRKNVEARVNRILQFKTLNPNHKTLADIIGQTPEAYINSIGCGNVQNIPAIAQLGKHADQYHTRICHFARFFSSANEGTVYNANDLTHILNELTGLEQNMSSSKVHLCLKMK